MRNLNLQDKDFQKELKVVMEERRLRTDDKPTSLTYEQFIATAFLSSPVRIPTIGWMDDLENMQLDDLQAWYGRWYAPNNAIVVVVGDVEPDAVLALAKKYFGPLKPEKIVSPKPRVEPAQKGMRHIIVKAPAEVPYLVMGYKAPVLKTAAVDWEPYALDVLSGILDGGDSARFARELVRGSQVASSASASYDPYERLPTLFLLSGVPSDAHTMAELQDALLQQVRRVQESLVSEDELARVKTSVVAGEVYQLDSTFYQAMKIGQLEAVGLDWQLLDEYVDRINKVTAEQVQAVARKYLVEDQLTIGVLDPLPMETGKEQSPAVAGGGHGH